jgi:hypothetical protein
MHAIAPYCDRAGYCCGNLALNDFIDMITLLKKTASRIFSAGGLFMPVDDYSGRSRPVCQIADKPVSVKKPFRVRRRSGKKFKMRHFRRHVRRK